MRSQKWMQNHDTYSKSKAHWSMACYEKESEQGFHLWAMNWCSRSPKTESIEETGHELRAWLTASGGLLDRIENWENGVKILLEVQSILVFAWPCSEKLSNRSKHSFYLIRSLQCPLWHWGKLEKSKQQFDRVFILFPQVKAGHCLREWKAKRKDAISNSILCRSNVQRKF